MLLSLSDNILEIKMGYGLFFDAGTSSFNHYS